MRGKSSHEELQVKVRTYTILHDDVSEIIFQNLKPYNKVKYQGMEMTNQNFDIFGNNLSNGT